MKIDWGLLMLTFVFLWFFGGLAILIHKTEGFEKFFEVWRKKPRKPS